MQQDPYAFLQVSSGVVTTSSSYQVLADLTPNTGTVLNQSQLHSMSLLVQELGLKPKALYLLRDPLQRSISQLSMIIHNDLRENFRVYSRPGTPEYLRETDHLVKNNLYGITMKSRSDVIIKRARALEASIPFQTILFDELFSQETMDRVAEFLTLETIVIDQKKVNHHESVQLSIDSLRALALSLRPTYQYLKSYFGNRGFPKGWAKSLEYFDGDL